MNIRAVIEMPAGTKHKYEMKRGKLVLDRTLDIRVPHNYGFIPGTLAADGDALDVFVPADESIPAGVEAAVTPVAMAYCKDGGVSDEKVIATLSDLEFNGEEVKQQVITSIVEYLKTYKKGFEVISLTFNKKEIESFIKRASKRKKRKK